MPLFQQPFMSGGFPSMNRVTTVGGWVELGRTTLGSAASSITVSGLTNKRYLQFLLYSPVSGSNVQPSITLNSDTGTNYAYRLSEDGAADSTSVNNTSIAPSNGIFTGDIGFEVGYLANYSTKEKEMIKWHVNNRTGTGAGIEPKRKEQYAKWSNTTDAVSSISYASISSTFATGAELVVLGWDPADTHTTNFWEELASVSGTGSSTTLDTGAFTAKKYLYFQAYLDGNGSSLTTNLWRFNSDSGSNYASRYSRNGAADGTNTSIAHLNINPTGAATYENHFYSGFIINNSANEKLVICHGIAQNTAGAGTAPVRVEATPKWANTSNQITSIQIVNDDTVNFGTNSILKVWGSD